MLGRQKPLIEGIPEPSNAGDAQRKANVEKSQAAVKRNRRENVDKDIGSVSDGGTIRQSRNQAGPVRARGKVRESLPLEVQIAKKADRNPL